MVGGGEWAENVSSLWFHCCRTPRFKRSTVAAPQCCALILTSDLDILYVNHSPVCSRCSRPPLPSFDSDRMVSYQTHFQISMKAVQRPVRHTTSSSEQDLASRSSHTPVSLSARREAALLPGVGGGDKGRNYPQFDRRNALCRLSAGRHGVFYVVFQNAVIRSSPACPTGQSMLLPTSTNGSRGAQKQSLRPPPSHQLWCAYNIQSSWV